MSVPCPRRPFAGLRMAIAAACRFAPAVALALGALEVTAAPLTLDDALHLAEVRSRQLSAQQAAASAAREMGVAAGQRPDPTLKAGVTNLPIDGADRLSLTRDFMTMRSVGLMQEFTRNEKLKARSARFEREAELAEAAHRLALARLQRDTAMVWLQRHFLQRMRELLAAQRGEAQLQIDAAEAAYRGGRGLQADVFAARSALALLDDRLAQTEGELATATTQLTRWIGAPGAGELAAAPPLDRVALHEGELDAQLAHHPQLQVLARQEAIAQADAEVANAGKKADLSVELMLSQRGSAYSKMVSLTLSMPLQWDQANRQEREVAAKLALVAQVRAEREETTRAYVAEAATMLHEWRSNRARLARYDQTLQPLAAERTRAALAAYRGAGGPLSAVLEARRGEIDTRMERLRLEVDTARLWAQLNHLVPASPGAAARP